MVPEGFNDLVRRSRDGEAAAVEQLLTLIQPWLDTLSRPWAEGADLAQEAWLRSWQNLDQFQGSTDDARTLELFRAWLRRIVERLGLNTIRSRLASRRRPPIPLVRLDASSGDRLRPELLAPGPTPEASVEQQERGRLVRKAMDHLTDETDRTIVRMRFFEGLSLRQIAERLDRNHEQVRQRFHAALRRLETELKGLS